MTPEEIERLQLLFANIIEASEKGAYAETKEFMREQLDEILSAAAELQKGLRDE